MKTLVLGLDSAAPELLFGFDDLPNLRQLMAAGAYGGLESVVPPTAIPAWISLATSQDPGSLGVYGVRNRIDHSYGGLGVVHSQSISEPAIWDLLAREGKRSILVRVPPCDPPQRINGISVGCAITPDTATAIFTHPPEISEELRRLVGHYPLDIQRSGTDDRSWLRDQIFAMSRSQFRVARHLLQTHPWDYFQLVDTGLDSIQRAFWRDHDPRHTLHVPDSPFRDTITDYYRHLDDEIGKVLELLSDETIVLVVSSHGAQRLNGAFALNDWLVPQGFLVLNRHPETVTPSSELDMNWDKTSAGARGETSRRSS